MTNVYFRHHNGNMGHIQVGTNDHVLAIAAVEEQLADDWRVQPKPVLAVIAKDPK